MKKRKTAMTVVLWGLLFAWLGMIYYLSTQNGEETAQMGMAWTKRLAVYIYENPTEAQLIDLHIVLRKVAHLFLFFLLGSMTTWISAVTFPRVRGIRKGYYLIVSLMITIGCGYFDEWHKQFIIGRHFDHTETLLNIKAGIAGVIIAVLVILICRIVNWCMREEI